MRKYPLLGPLLVLLLVAAAAPSEAQSRTEQPRGMHRVIGVVGDSYAKGLAMPLAKLLPDDGDLVGRQEVGARTAEVLSWLPSAIAQGATMILVSAGANDGNAQAHAKALATDAERQLRAGGWRGELVWLANPLGRWVAPDGARVIHPPNVETPDGVHPTADGYRLWAEKIAREL